jgi:hypothetical protein
LSGPNRLSVLRGRWRTARSRAATVDDRGRSQSHARPGWIFYFDRGRETDDEKTDLRLYIPTPKWRPVSGIRSRSFPQSVTYCPERDVPMIFAQWQKGVPITVFPTNLALATAVWPSV